MRIRALGGLAPILFAGACATFGRGGNAPSKPLVDYHQHLVSPTFAPVVHLAQRDGKALMTMLDAAGIDKALVLSVGYSYGDERKGLDDPDRLTRAENDWTSAQVAESRGRLVGFCSANPLRDAAIAEIERCLHLPGMRGIEQHFGNAGVSLRDPAHVSRMMQIFTLAQSKGAPVLVHLRARGGANYGAEDARVFLDKLVTAAPSIEIVIAHLGYPGPGYPLEDSVMAVFGAATERQDPRMRNIYFDVATNVHEGTSPQEAALIVTRIRQVGAARVLYGSDLNPPGGSIRSGWEIFHSKLQLTEVEFRTIAGNVTRFMR